MTSNVSFRCACTTIGTGAILLANSMINAIND
jgi:hypothetical protein